MEGLEQLRQATAPDPHLMTMGERWHSPLGRSGSVVRLQLGYGLGGAGGGIVSA